jgi:hypothetical protein
MALSSRLVRDCGSAYIDVVRSVIVRDNVGKRYMMTCVRRETAKRSEGEE